MKDLGKGKAKKGLTEAKRRDKIIMFIKMTGGWIL